MIADCDLRTARLIKKEIQNELVEIYGSVLTLEILSIRHKDDLVTVIGEFVSRPGEQEKKFAFTIPRVDGPLDHFL